MGRWSLGEIGYQQEEEAFVHKLPSSSSLSGFAETRRVAAVSASGLSTVAESTWSPLTTFSSGSFAKRPHSTRSNHYPGLQIGPALPGWRGMREDLYL